VTAAVHITDIVEQWIAAILPAGLFAGLMVDFVLITA
jgi:hypothetical protein